MDKIKIPLIVKIRSWFYPVEDYMQDYYPYSTTRNDAIGCISNRPDLSEKLRKGITVHEEFIGSYKYKWRYIGREFWKNTRKTMYYEKESA